MEPKYIMDLTEKKKYVQIFYEILMFETKLFYPRKFLQALEGYARLEGNSVNEEYQMYFANEIPEGEPDSFESGIEIDISWPAVDEDIIIPLSHEEFYPMLCEECEKYLEEHPEDEEEVQELLAKIKVALNV